MDTKGIHTIPYQAKYYKYMALLSNLHQGWLKSEALLHMNTVYRYRAVLLAHNGQESVNVTCPRYYREDLSDSSSYEPTMVGGAPSLVTEMLMAVQMS